MVPGAAWVSPLRSRLSRLKKLSATALSWQFLRLLIECSILWARRNAAQSLLVYWLP